MTAFKDLTEESIPLVEILKEKNGKYMNEHLIIFPFLADDLL